VVFFGSGELALVAPGAPGIDVTPLGGVDRTQPVMRLRSPACRSLRSMVRPRPPNEARSARNRPDLLKAFALVHSF